MRTDLTTISPDNLDRMDDLSNRITPVYRVFNGLQYAIDQLQHLRITANGKTRSLRGDELTALTIIIANAIVSVHRHQLYVTYSLMDSSIRRDLDGFSNRRAFERVLECLEQAGYIDLHIGGKRGDRYIRSRFSICPPMYALIRYRVHQAFKWDAEQLVEFVKRGTHERVTVDFPDASKNHQILSRTNYLINGGRVRYRIGYNARVPLTEFKQLIHVNDDGELVGGRIYGTGGRLQGLSQYERLSGLIIDGEDVCELDYKGTAPNTVREMVGDIDRPDFDPYAFSENHPRPMCKTTLAASLNSVKRLSAVRSVSQQIVELRQKRQEAISKFGDLIQCDTELDASYETCQKLLDAMIEHNPYLAEFVNRDYGMRLQTVDSEIALFILNHFQSIDQVCIPYHDSFIVKRSMRSELFKTMRKAWKHVLGDDRFCAVDEKTVETSLDRVSTPVEIERLIIGVMNAAQYSADF